MTDPPSQARPLALEISKGFTAASFDMSKRSGAGPPGWDTLPESLFAAALASAGETPAFIRTAITLVAAMDRARDAMGLWHRAVQLRNKFRWAFVPSDVARASLTSLTDVLRTTGVSQRHLQDAAAWRRIAESLVAEPGSPVARVVAEGLGDAATIRGALATTTDLGRVKFPFLGGPKVGPMWVRMMAYPGASRVNGIGKIPVAVDVQVRRVTENLGVTDTMGLDLEAARPLIQDAWFRGVEAGGADGPASLINTCAALDPALWYFGRVGCTLCEAAGHRIPLAAICPLCRLPASVTTGALPHQQPPAVLSSDERPLIGLVGCVKTKLPYAAPARDLYISPLFAGRRRAVERRTKQWFVLSAKYGLTHPDTVIEPYDRALSDLPAQIRREWARNVLGQLRRELGDLKACRFEIHAGHSYFGYGLADALRAEGAAVALPMEGLTEGKQLQLYSALTNQRIGAGHRARPRGGSPYSAVVDILNRSGDTAVTLDFADIERAIGRALPPSARKYEAWWHGSAAHRPPWFQAGWRPRPKLSEARVEFIRADG